MARTNPKEYLSQTINSINKPISQLHVQNKSHQLNEREKRLRTKALYRLRRDCADRATFHQKRKRQKPVLTIEVKARD